MPVSVEQEQLEPCKVALQIQVPPEQVARTLDNVFARFARNVAVPGFRKGKAPRKLVERYIDPDAVKEAAVEKLIQDGFKQALEQTGLEPYDQASVEAPEFSDDEGFRFRATVPLRPDVQLGEYRGLQAKRVEVAIGEGDIDREMARIREQAARFEEVTEPARDGDRVHANVSVTVDGEVVTDASAEGAWLLVGGNFPDFDQGIIGIAPDEERSFTFTYPADMQDEARAGKQAQATVKAIRVQRRIVPEPSDEFAESLGHESLEEMRGEIRRQMQEAAKRQADDFLERDLLEQVVRNATIHFPDSMVTEEVAARTNNLIKNLERRRLTLNDYLASTRQDLATFEAELAEESRRQIRNSLILLRLAEAENIKLEPSDVDEEIERRAKAAKAEPSIMRRLLEEQGELDALQTELFFRKILNHLKSVSTITEAT
jgi:trigger factor